MFKKKIAYLFMLLHAFLVAQLPETDLWLFKIKNNKGNLILSDGSNITNRKGYDNQPRFTSDNKSIVYVSIMEDKQADIYRYDIAKNESNRLTQTKESEYSPDYTPDGKYLSCVVVEEDSTQRIWLYNLNGSFNKRFSVSVDSVGYYTWYSNDTLLYYKLTQPHSLFIYYNSSNQEKWLCDNPSRAFRKLKGNKFMYAVKDSGEIRFSIYHTEIKRSDNYSFYKSNNEDFIWNEKIGLLKSEGSQLLYYDEKLNSWLTLFDFSAYGIKKITRFSLDNKNEQIVIIDNN